MRTDRGHGSPHDRGGADFWYHRPFSPHYYEGATYSTKKVERAAMTPEEIAEYQAGWDKAEAWGEEKDWG